MNEPGHPSGAAGLHETPGSLYVATQERRGVLDAAVHVALCGEVNGGIAASDRINNRRVTYIHADKAAAGVAQSLRQVAQIPGVGELIQNHNLITWMSAQNVMNEVGSYESGTACNENLHDCNSTFATNAASALLKAFSRTKLPARHKDSKVPASVHQPSRMS